MPKIREIRIKCGHCQHIFRSPFRVDSTDTLESGVIAGNIAQCPNCKEKVHCNSENMSIFYEDSAGGEMGPDFGDNKV